MVAYIADNDHNHFKMIMNTIKEISLTGYKEKLFFDYLKMT